jgi:anaerobic magnesium-protoporphyrin IX monomethyl ester cyclase
MKLLLINPYFGQVSNNTEGATHSPPLGLGFIATYVRDHTDCDVEIVDPVPQGLTDSDVLAKVTDADFVGLSIYTDTRFYCMDFAKKIKERNPQCVLIVGGAHTYFLDKLILEHYPFIDVIVRGEGEQTAAEIVKGTSLQEIAGITYKHSSGEIIRNADRPLIQDIDPLYVDYGLLPDMSLYKTDIEAPLDMRRLKTAYMIESRGCPFKCTYCANQHWQGTWRAVSPSRTVDKMEHLVRNYGVQYFRFYDDLFTTNKNRTLEFCRILKDRKLNVHFRVLARAGISKDTLKALRDAGCESIGIGIESGSDRMLKRIQKGTTRQQIIETINSCKELGLWIVGSFIVSLPGESREDYRATLTLANAPDTFMANILHLLPGTSFYNELKEKGEIEDTIWFERQREGHIFYCQENFASAPFSFAQAQWLARYMKYYAWMRHPLKAIKQYGIGVGIAMVVFSGIDTLFKGRLYKIAYRYRKLYRRFTMRG